VEEAGGVGKSRKAGRVAPGSNQWSLPCEHRASHYAGQENADVKQFKSLLAGEIIKAGIILGRQLR